MAEKSSTIEVFLDLLPNQPRVDETREQFREMLRTRFEHDLPQSVERIWDLPPIILKEPQAEYVALLVEARHLYVAGSFYSCVAMCGIVGERMTKDVLRAAIRIENGGALNVPSENAFAQLERIELSAITRFLKESGLVSTDAAKAAKDLTSLRNQYAHARGKDPERDALRAIKLLHAVVEGTVSMFKYFEIKDGVLVRKPAAGESPP